MGVEHELKLQGRPEDLQRLLREPAITAALHGRPKRQRLAATYYDTEDGRLRTAHGMSLRVRREGKSYVQTVKHEGKANGVLLSRDEWEMPLDDDRPDPTRLTDPALADLVATLTADGIVPIARTDIRRDTVDLDWSDEHGRTAVVNLALDEGTIEAGGRSTEVGELELELVEGDPACLFALALRFAEIVPLRFGTQGKWQRGVRLHAGLAAEPAKAQRPALHAQMNIEEVMTAAIAAALHQWLANEAAVLESADPEAIHQMRVALRRLRSLLTLFKGLIPEAQRTSLSAELRAIVQALGATRDLDVFASEMVGSVRRTRPDDPSIEALGELACKAKVDAQGHAQAMLASSTYGRTALRMTAWLELRGWRVGPDAPSADRLAESAVPAAAAVLDRGLHKIKHRGKGFADLAPPERHKVRIACKKLRYGADAFAGLFDAHAAKPYLKRLSHLQDLMGRFNDAILCGKMVDRLLGDPEAPVTARREAALGGGLVVGWHAHATKADEAGLLEAWRAFKHAKPFWRTPR